MTRARSPQRPPLFTVRTLVILVVATLVGIAIGILTYMGTKRAPGALLAGAGAFGACLIGLHQLVE
jgi:hypothetical protein